MYFNHTIPEISSIAPNLIDPSGEWENSNMENCPSFVINGMVQDLNGADLYRHFEGATPSRHLTVVFNLFVFF